MQFVNTTSDAPNLDDDARRYIRSSAMQYYRRKQREDHHTRQTMESGSQTPGRDRGDIFETPGRLIDGSSTDVQSMETQQPDFLTEMLTSTRIPSPRKALVSDGDYVIYQSAWWHQHGRPSRQQFQPYGWQQKCKDDWNVGFWQAAQSDRTLLEVFKCFATAKETAVRGLLDNHMYHHHKGKAIALVSKDINSNTTHPFEINPSH